MEIYITSISPMPTKKTINYLLNHIDQSTREKIKSFHFIEDQLRSMYGEYKLAVCIKGCDFPESIKCVNIIETIR